ncbi:MAG: nitrilase-related carbon-nitrogen hydrolase [Verrucomicrobiota bacterium]
MEVVCCQYETVWEDKVANLDLVSGLLASSPPASGSLVILPEMGLTGFSMNSSELAEPLSNSPSLKALANLAQKHQVHLLAGLDLESGSIRTNDAALLAPNGSLVGRYSKTHPFTPSGEGDAVTRGLTAVTLPLGEWTLQPAVCYDLRFPELFRQPNPAADLIVVLANWPTPRVEHWLTLLKARAIENQAFVIGVNRVGSDPHLDFPGKSVIFGPKGELIAEAGDSTQLLTASLDLNQVRQWRNDFPASRDRLPLSELSLATHHS